METGKKRFKIITLGCKVNLFESESIAEALSKSGYRAAGSYNDADIIIINTCAVTSKASMQSRQAIRKAARSKDFNKDILSIVTGCYAQIGYDEIKKIDDIDMIIGHGDKHNIPEIISERDYYDDLKKDIFLEKTFSYIPVIPAGIRSRPFLKIQDGCSSFCSYCIVPYARGRSRSMPFERVLDYLKAYGDLGYNEAVLTGIHLGNYGLDLVPATNLFDLLKEIERTKLVYRIRLSSIEPNEVTENIVRLAADSGILCRHFHLTLQSGDDGILSRMKRGYKTKDFRNIVEKIAKLIPNAAIGADIIAGFPDETEEAFNNTFSLVEDLPITYLHVFPFSARQGTPAAKFSRRVPTKIIKMRAEKMRELGSIKKNSFYNSMKDSVFEAVVEGRDKNEDNFFKCMTSNYIPVFFSSNKYEAVPGSMVKVRIDEVEPDNRVFGEPIL